MGGQVNSEEYKRFVLCREFGWTYEEYSNQPPFFTEELMIFLIQESKKNENDLKPIKKPFPKGGIRR